jgi:hypothetical protein
LHIEHTGKGIVNLLGDNKNSHELYRKMASIIFFVGLD